MRNQPVRPLIAALVVAMAPLVVQVPWWAVGWCAACWGYLLVQDRRGWPVLSRWARLTVFMAGMGAVLLSAGLRFDGGDFVTLLVVMAGIKPLEIRSRRDSMVTVFLAYFLIITSLFVFENLSMTIYLFVSVWTTTGVLIHVNDPGGAVRRQMGLAARLMLVAVPLMALLFLFFPRFSGSFWGSPWNRHGRSGFSSTMRIGDVSRLVLEDAPAFSVSFDSPVPDAEQLYWRGIVFQRFDGRTWHPARSHSVRRGRIGGSNLSRYTVMLEPHGYRHLFVLDLPTTANPVAAIMDDHTLVARRPVRQRFHYGAASIIDYLQEDVAEAPASETLQLPAGQHPRTVALGKQWASAHETPEAIVAAALTFFRENRFSYTLRPDRLGGDAVDGFLFTSRKGFCEHFATGFAVLMRAAGVPTRLVGGYQGGRWNALGDFFTVRHSDAHVWCEVWLAHRGWVRVDPTFVVAPERIDVGIEGAFDPEGLLAFLGSDPANVLARWTESLRQAWEAANTRWNMWFMGFSAEDQLSLLKQMGLSVGRRGGWLLFMVLPSLFIVAVVLLGRMGRNVHEKMPGDEALKIYARFLKKMARAGLPKARHQGPLDYARSAGRRVPEWKHDVDDIAGLYIGLRYGRENSPQALKALRQLVRQFRPERRSGRRTEF